MLGHAKGTLPVSGQLLRILPNSPKDGQPATVELESVADVMATDPHDEVLKSFPGPLVRCVFEMFWLLVCVSNIKTSYTVCVFVQSYTTNP